jgi:uncharacterized protein YchJ
MGNHEKRMVTVISAKAGYSDTLNAEKTSRNAKCKCGSGKKAKKCCGVETKYYSKP